MRNIVLAGLALSAVILGPAAAQIEVTNLTGRYRCVDLCKPGFEGNPAFVTQYALDLNIADESGAAARAWIDRPGHIWIEAWQEGAIYSPDGLTIQFDRGRVWRRELDVPPRRGR
jgi:hypothetical protein